MSSVNVLPTAPQYGETEKLYPDLPAQTANNFRLQKISDVQKELEVEAAHYRRVAKNIKKFYQYPRFNYRLGWFDCFSFLSWNSNSSLWHWRFRWYPNRRCCCFDRPCFTGLTAFSKKLQTKLTKHENTPYTLAITKHNTVCELVSKALNDNEITDGEFNLIIRELQKYHELKAAIRSANNKQSGKRQPDIDEIKKQIRREERQNLQKNIVFGRRVEVGFERVNAGF